MNKPLLIGILLLAALMGATSQILFRKSNAAPGIGMLTNWTLMIGVFLMGLAFLINLYAYQQGGLVTVVYPTLATSYIFALILAWAFLGESVSAGKIAGSAMLAGGIALMWSGL